MNNILPSIDCLFVRINNLSNIYELIDALLDIVLVIKVLEFGIFDLIMNKFHVFKNSTKLERESNIIQRRNIRS